MLQINFNDMEEIFVTVDKIVIPENRRWAIAIPVPIEVEEMIYATAELNPTSISWKNILLKIVAMKLIPSSGKFKILGFNAIKDREETLRAG